VVTKMKNAIRAGLGFSKIIFMGLGIAFFLNVQTVMALTFSQPLLTVPITPIYILNYSWSNLFLPIPAAMKTQYPGYYQPHPGQIRTLAGDGDPNTLNQPYVVALDETNNVLYYSDTKGFAVYSLDLSTDEIKRVAGTESSGHATGIVTAVNGAIGLIKGMAVASNGDLYISDVTNHVIRKVTMSAATPKMTIYAGTGFAGNTGLGGLATSAKLNFPYGLAFNNAGLLYVADRAIIV